MAFAIAAVPVQAQVKNITLKASNTPVSTVMQQIEEQSGYTFFYNNDIDVTQSVSAHIASSDINSVVTAVLKGTDIAHRITDNRVVLFVGGGDAADDQERSISGKVTDAAGLPLVGVTVLVTGTNFAAVTDVNGGYTVRVPGSGAEIVYSYIGYQSQQRIVGSQTVINLALQESTAEIGAVVVTALGIKRDQKSLTYNVQQIAGDDISIVKDVSVVNSLVGKVAGVRINQSSSGTGGSTRVVMRGAKSLFGDNNVLYVLNGIPMMSLSLRPSRTSLRRCGRRRQRRHFEHQSRRHRVAVGADGCFGRSALRQPRLPTALILTTRREKQGVSVYYSNNTTFSIRSSPISLPEHLRPSVGRFQKLGREARQALVVRPQRFLPDGLQHAEHRQRGIEFGAQPVVRFGRFGQFARHHSQQRIFALQLHDPPRTRAGQGQTRTRHRRAGLSPRASRRTASRGTYYNPLLPVYLFPPGAISSV